MLLSMVNGVEKKFQGVRPFTLSVFKSIFIKKVFESFPLSVHLTPSRVCICLFLFFLLFFCKLLPINSIVFISLSFFFCYYMSSFTRLVLSFSASSTLLVIFCTISNFFCQIIFLFFPFLFFLLILLYFLAGMLVRVSFFSCIHLFMSYSS
jgi:hypothetical protein